MPFIQCSFYSEVLGLQCSMDVLLPQRPRKEMRKAPRRLWPTLYLLHGLSDDHTCWQRWTSIERYVQGMDLAVIMPAAGRSFYTDMVNGGRYWTFISEELPDLARDFFPLSADRLDNYVAGISMGGYGAFKLALTHPDRFAAAGSLSGALDIVADVSEDDGEGWQAEMRSIFGRLDRLEGSRHDLFALAEQASRSPARPRLYQCCALDDPLLEENIRFRDHVRSLPMDLTYRQGPGGHDWIYWDKQIQKILEWLPIQ